MLCSSKFTNKTKKITTKTLGSRWKMGLFPHWSNIPVLKTFPSSTSFLSFFVVVRVHLLLYVVPCCDQLVPCIPMRWKKERRAEMSLFRCLRFLPLPVIAAIARLTTPLLGFSSRLLLLCQSTGSAVSVYDDVSGVIAIHPSTTNKSGFCWLPIHCRCASFHLPFFPPSFVDWFPRSIVSCS